MPSRKTKKHKPSLYLGLTLILISLIITIPQLRTLAQYHSLNNGHGAITQAFFSQNKRITEPVAHRDGTPHYSYGISYSYKVAGKAYDVTQSGVGSGLYALQPHNLTIRYSPADPSVSILQVTNLGLKNKDYMSDQQNNSWLIAGGMYFLFSFGLLTVLAGLGQFPNSWMWGAAVNRFGIVATLSCIAFTGLLVLITVLILG